MPQMKKDQEMSRRDFKCKFWKGIACIKWYDSKSLLLVGRDLETITSIFNAQSQFKGSPSKININGPSAIKLYTSKLGGFDFMDPL